MTDFTKLQVITTEYRALGQSKSQLIVWASRDNHIYYSYDGERWQDTGVTIVEWTESNDFALIAPIGDNEIAIGIKDGVSYVLYRIGTRLNNRMYFTGDYGKYSYIVMTCTDSYVIAVLSSTDKVRYVIYENWNINIYRYFYERERNFDAYINSKVLVGNYIYVSLWDGATQDNIYCTLLVFDPGNQMQQIDSVYTLGYARTVYSVDAEIDLLIGTVYAGGGDLALYEVYGTGYTRYPSRNFDSNVGKFCEIRSEYNHHVQISVKYIDNVYHDSGYWLNIKSTSIHGGPFGWTMSHTIFFKPSFNAFIGTYMEEPEAFDGYMSLSNPIDIGAGQLLVLKGNDKVAYTEEAGATWKEAAAGKSLPSENCIPMPNGNILDGYNLIRMNVKNSGVKFMDDDGEIRECRAFLLHNPDAIKLKRIHVINAQGEHVILYDNKRPQPDRKCLSYFNGEEVRYIYSI